MSAPVIASAEVRSLVDVLVAGLGAATWSTGQTPTTPATSRSWSASASVAVTVMPLYALVNDAVRPTLRPSLPASLRTCSCEAFAADDVPPSAVEAPAGSDDPPVGDRLRVLRQLGRRGRFRRRRGLDDGACHGLRAEREGERH